MKKVLFIGVPVIIVIAAVAFIVLKMLPKSAPEQIDVIPTPTIALPTIKDTIKVNLAPRSDNKAVNISISGLTSDIISVEYELTYVTGDNLQRGVLGKITTNGESTISRDDIVLGTCSSGKCVYDTGVKSIDLSMKFNSSEGAQIFRQTYQLD